MRKAMKICARIILSLVFVSTATACRSGSKYESSDRFGETQILLPERSYESNAEGAAYTADSMHPRIPIPSRPDWRPMEFYFKECSLIGDLPYYSKTAYQCSER
jgi:hypothetical protein